MPIVLKCTCGRSLQTPDELAGKKARCPGCLAVLDVPAPLLLPELLTLLEPLPLPAPVVMREQEEVLPVAVPVTPARPRSEDSFVQANAPPAPLPRNDFEEDEDLPRRVSRSSRRERDLDREFGGKGIASLVLGLLGLIAWCLPILGLPVTIGGLALGIHGLKSANYRGLAIVGVVLNIIGLVLSVANAALGFYLGATGQHPLVR